MRYGQRRWLDRFLLGAASAALGGVAIGAAALGDGERITLYSASAAVDADGLAQVSEVIEYDFGPSDRRGIFREVPGLDPNTNITVESATAPDQFIVESLGNEARIRIGNPDITIDGRHRYAIDYPITVDSGDDRIAWNAVGAEWPVSMDNIEIHMTAKNNLLDIRCSSGEAGTWDGCTAEQPEPGHLVVTIDELDDRQGVTVSALRGDELAAAPALPPGPDLAAEDPGTGLLLPGLTGLLGAGVAAAATSMAVRRAGREWVWAGGAADAAYGPRQSEEYPVRRVDHEELSLLASTEFAPPRDITAWQGGMLHAEHITGDHPVAWLLERAIAEEVSIEGEADDLTLRRLPVDTDVDKLLGGLFGGRTTVDLSSYDKQFSAGWKALSLELGDWIGDSEYWDRDGDRRRIKAWAFGVPAFLIGLAVLVVSAVVSNRVGPVWLIGVAAAALLGGAGYALMQRAWELKVRTPAGSGLWILIESFRRFVENSDARHVDDAAKRGVLLEYSAWAVALGLGDRWAEAVKEADLDESTSIGTDALFFAALGPRLSAATFSASTAPSSSGGGGGGGGFVGGGGGGGGGGSW